MFAAFLAQQEHTSWVTRSQHIWTWHTVQCSSLYSWDLWLGNWSYICWRLIWDSKWS